MKRRSSVLIGLLVATLVAVYPLLRPRPEKPVSVPIHSELQPTLITQSPNTETPPQAVPPPSPLTVESADRMKPAANWKYRGNATPEAAFESVLWATETNNTIMLSSLISISENLRATAKDALSKLDLATRNRFAINSPEQLIALTYTMSLANEAYEFLSATEAGESNAIVVGRLKIEGVNKPLTIKFRLHYEGGG